MNSEVNMNKDGIIIKNKKGKFISRLAKDGLYESPLKEGVENEDELVLKIKL